jgi:hypothetical protein
MLLTAVFAGGWRDFRTPWLEPLIELWTRLPAEESWIIGALGCLFLLLMARFAGWNRKQLLARQMLQQIRDSNLHPVQVHEGPNARGFVVESDPAPAPFEQVMILYRPASRVDPIGLVRWLTGRHAQTLRIRAMLRTPPAVELVWSRNASAAGRPVLDNRHFPGGQDWLHRTLDFNLVQYSTRGTNTAPLEHVFAEFHTRFGRALRFFVVRSETPPHVEIVLAAPRLDPLLVAGLLISLRSVGRAARLH